MLKAYINACAPVSHSHHNASLCRVQDYRALQLAASTLLKHGEDESAKEVMLKMEDWPALIQVHIDAEAWDRAFMTAKRCPEQEPVVHRAHAEWLITHDRCGLVHSFYSHSGADT